MLKIIKSTSDGVTGHISCDVQVVEVDGNSTTTSVVETHGIHPLELQAQYGGDVKLWLDGIHRKMLAQHDDRKAAAKAMQALQSLGTIILTDEETKHGTEVEAGRTGLDGPDADQNADRQPAA